VALGVPEPDLTFKLPPSHPYRQHADNYRAISRGLTQAERLHKAAIRKGDLAATDLASRVHYLLVGIVAENALRKIAHDPAGFNDKERTLISRERNQLGQWTRAVELAFRRHYSVPIHLEIDDTTTTRQMKARYDTIISLLEDDLAEIIEDRNDVAHGQWARRMNAKGQFTGPAPAPLNYLQIARRAQIIKHIAAVITDLVVSEPTFQRDFSTLYQEIVSLKGKLAGSDYTRYAQQVQATRRT
jgi:hypothetical protein